MRKCLERIVVSEACHHVSSLSPLNVSGRIQNNSIILEYTSFTQREQTLNYKEACPVSRCRFWPPHVNILVLYLHSQLVFNFLGGDNDNANYYLRIADQTGKPLDLPPAERKVK